MQTVYVATGAPLPTVADAVVPRSQTQGTEARVSVTKPVASGEFVRRTGEDVQPGDVAVRSGAFIGSPQVGLLAAVGRDKILVHPAAPGVDRLGRRRARRRGPPPRSGTGRMTSTPSRSPRPPATPARTPPGWASRRGIRAGCGN